MSGFTRLRIDARFLKRKYWKKYKSIKKKTYFIFYIFGRFLHIIYICSLPFSTAQQSFIVCVVCIGLTCAPSSGGCAQGSPFFRSKLVPTIRSIIMQLLHFFRKRSRWPWSEAPRAPHFHPLSNCFSFARLRVINLTSREFDKREKGIT